MNLDFDDAVEFIVLAKNKELEDRLFMQWVVQLPWMSSEDDSYISFEDYRDRLTGKSICMKSKAEILAESLKIEAAARGEKNGA